MNEEYWLHKAEYKVRQNEMKIAELELLVKNQPTGIQLRDRIGELEKDFKDNGVYTNKEEYQSIFTEINELKEQKTQLGNIFNADISEIREVLREFFKKHDYKYYLKKLDGKEPTDDIPYEKDMIIYKGRAYNQKLHRIVEMADLEELKRLINEKDKEEIWVNNRWGINMILMKYLEDADD